MRVLMSAPSQSQKADALSLQQHISLDSFVAHVAEKSLPASSPAANGSQADSAAAPLQHSLSSINGLMQHGTQTVSDIQASPVRFQLLQRA